MADESKLSIVIDAENRAGKALNEVNSGLEGVKNKLESMKPAFKTMAAVGTAAFAAVVAVVGTSVKAYADSQAAMTRVDTVLKTMNVNFDKAKTVILEAAKAAIKLGFDDEDAAESITKMYQRTGDMVKAIELSNLAMDLSRAKQIDLGTATNLVSLALSGSGRALLQYGIVIKDTASPLEALGILQEKVGGQAKAFAGTFQGQTEILQAQIKNLREAIGKPFAEALTNVLLKLQPFLDRMVQWAEDNPKLITQILMTAGAVSALVAGLGLLGLALPKIILGIEYLGKALNVLKINPIILAITALIVAVVLISEKFKEFSDEVGGFGTAWKLFCLQWKTYFLEAMLAIGEAINKVLGWIPGLGTLIGNSLVYWRNELSKTNDEFNRVSVEGMSRVIEKGKEIAKATTEAADAALKAAQIMKDFGGMSEVAFNSVVEAVKSLRDEMKKAQQDMLGITKDYNKDVTSENESYQDEALKLYTDAINEKIKLEEDKNKAIADGNVQEVADLTIKIGEQQAIIDSFNALKIANEAQIAEALRVSQMNEMDRLAYDHEKKLMLIQIESLKKQVAITQEMVAIQTKTNLAMDLIGQEAAASVKADIEKNKSFKDMLDDSLGALKLWVANAKSQYQDLVNAASQVVLSAPIPLTSPYSPGYQPYVPHALGGIVTKPHIGLVGEAGPEAIIPLKKGGLGNINITITGNTFMSDEEAAEKIGDRIIRILKMQNRFAY